jgi:hypothetical protein
MTDKTVVRYVVATDIYHLEAKANALLASSESWELFGVPQVFGHEMYIQTFVNHKGII